MIIPLNIDENNKKTLAVLLSEKGFPVANECNGRGICGKCAVRVVECSLPYTKADKNCLSKEELCSGYRLACMTVPHTNLKVELPNTQKDIVIQSTMEISHRSYQAKRKDFFFLIDIGSTTIAILIGHSDGTVIDSETFTNPQIPYGTDIMSRLKAAAEGQMDSLSECLTSALKKKCEELLIRNQFSTAQISHCYIAGNTAMIHLLLKYPVETLMKAPFLPFRTEAIFFDDTQIPTTIFPSLSAFIGGDIVAGLYDRNFETEKSPSLLIDLGTNGEMALTDGNKIYTASVAAGPAFEGSCLSCGGSSIPGAITNVQLGGLYPKLKTIGNKLPIHLCGTGAISLIPQLLEKGYINADGSSSSTFPDAGIFLCKTSQGRRLCFTLDDFRQIQLALASLQAGYKTLLNEANLPAEALANVYLAGGLGCRFPLKEAFSFHLFPPEWENKISSIGNSCLSGLMKYACIGTRDVFQYYQPKNPRMISVSLADNEYYKKEFIDSLSYLFSDESI